MEVEALNHIGINKSLVDNKVSLIMSNTGVKKEKSHNRELNDMFFSPNTKRFTRSSRMKRAGLMTRVLRNIIDYRMYCENVKGQNI